MTRRLLILIASMMSLAYGLAQEQRTITPVDIDDEQPPKPILHYYDKHGEPLDEPVYTLIDADTVARPTAKPVYPLVNGISVGVNFFDAIMKLAGQKHSSYDIWADISLHNWFFPIVEVGVGYGKNSPEGANYTYTAKPSVYAKVGLNYNFLYKSNPAYQVFLGLRGALSSYQYDIDGITISSPYWDQTNEFSLSGLRSTTFYGEIVGGIKVMLWKNLSMGWTARYHIKFRTWGAAEATPWFIPGYGTNSPLSATLSLIYTIPVRSRKAAAPGLTDQN